MSTYAELMAQAQALMAQAEQLRAKERSQALVEVRRLMAEHQLTVQDIERGGRVFRRPSPKAANDKPVRYYASPTGETWRWRPGPRPLWLREALSQGKRLEDFEVPEPALTVVSRQHAKRASA